MSGLRKPLLLAGMLPIIVAVGASGDAQVKPPPAPVLAPTLVRPVAGTVHRYDVGSSGTTFSWDQGPGIRTPTAPPFPSIFLQCLSRVGDPACSTATATSSDLAGSLPSVPVRNLPNPSVVAYRYSPVKTVPDTHLDQPIQWQVAACRTGADSTCVKSAPRALWFSTKDIAAVNVSANAYSTHEYNVSGEVRNLGSTDSGEFTVQIATWAVIVDTDRNACAKDPNHPYLRNEKTLYVIDSKGVPTQFADLPVDSAGNYIVSDVIGIYWPGSFFQSGNFTAASQPPLQNRPRGVASQTLSIGASRPQAYVSVVIVDPFNTLVEFDETNNRHAECDMLYAL
jgi:hypothetical protein